MARVFDLAARVGLYACLVVASVVWGGHRGWPLAFTEALAFVALGAVVLRMCFERRLMWISTPVTLPLAAFATLVGVQLILGNHRLAKWALAPAGSATDPPTPILLLGSAAPELTRDALVQFLAYASVYVVTVHLLQSRAAVERLVGVLVGLGAVLAFAGLLDYLHGEPLVIRWRDHPITAGRLTGTFVNADHFATWLSMLFVLGVGASIAHRAGSRPAEPGSSRREEWLSAEALYFLAVVLIGLGLLLTLSRGALLATVIAAVGLLTALRARRLARRSTTVIAGLLAVTVAYGVWIGLGPLLSRLTIADTDYAGRLTQYRASLPMLADFPLLGVGLGAYRDAFPRYQPAALAPGRVYYPYAHNDPLQLAIETGPLGGLILLWGIAAVARHARRFLFGPDRRRDRWSIALGVAALAGGSAALLHSFFDFSYRIPANGVLAAALLGLGTVVLQTRFRDGNVDLLARVRDVAVPSPTRRAFLAALAAAAALGLSVLAIEQALAEAHPGVLTQRSEYETALAARPLRRSLHMALARATAADGETDLALAHVARALALAPEDAVLRASAAGLLATMAEGAPDPAKREQMLARGVDQVRAAAQRDLTLLPSMVEWYVEAGLSADHLGSLAPPDALSQLQLAVTLERRGLSSEARAAYERAVSAAEPGERAQYRRFLAAALARAGDHRSAASELREAVRLVPDSVPYQMALAEELALSGEDGQAGFYYRRAAQRAEALAAAETAPSGRSRSRSARVALLNDLEVAAVGPRVEDPAEILFLARLALARFHVDHGEFAEALPLLEALAKRAEVGAPLQFALGITYANLGDWTAAERAIRRAIDLDGRNGTYRAYLAPQLFAREKFFEAIDQWRALAHLQPNDAEVQVQLARAYERVGEPREAFARYQRALQIDPANAGARRGLAQLTAGSSPK